MVSCSLDYAYSFGRQPSFHLSGSDIFIGELCGGRLTAEQSGTSQTYGFGSFTGGGGGVSVLRCDTL